MVRTLASMKDEPPSLLVCEQNVQCVKSFTYLGILIYSSCSSEPEICRWSSMTQTAMQSLDRHLWRLRIVTSTKLCLYNAYILPIMLYASECWTVNVQCIDALDQWCLRRSLDIRWHDFVQNDAVHRMTRWSPLSSIVKSRWLSLFRMNELADAANRILFVQLMDNWRRP